MAYTDSNTLNTHQSRLEFDGLYSAMSAALTHLDFSGMDYDSLSLTTCYCAETRSGLCHCLNFIGEALVTIAQSEPQETTPESLCYLGHGLTAIALLIPALTDMQKRTEAVIVR